MKTNDGGGKSRASEIRGEEKIEEHGMKKRNKGSRRTKK